MTNIDITTTEFAASGNALYGNLWYRKENVAYTHNGTFHADDVCSTALLELVFPGIEIKRVSHVPPNAELAFDIGLGKFDHHQDNAEVRQDGVTIYSSFGLLWKEIGPTIVAPQEAAIIDATFVKYIDATDNGQGSNPFSVALKAFNPTWNTDQSEEIAFRNAVEFAKIAILMLLKRARSSEEASGIVRSLCESHENFVGEHTLVLDQYMPYTKVCGEYPDVWYVIFRGNRSEGSWNLNTIGKMAVEGYRAPFPDKWFQKSHIYKPEDCTFIHRSGFMAVFSSFEAAKKAALEAEENHKRRLEAEGGSVA